MDHFNIQAVSSPQDLNGSNRYLLINMTSNNGQLETQAMYVIVKAKVHVYESHMLWVPNCSTSDYQFR
jgi:hypothetical protein